MTITELPEKRLEANCPQCARPLVVDGYPMAGCRVLRLDPLTIACKWCGNPGFTIWHRCSSDKQE